MEKADRCHGDHEEEDSLRHLVTDVLSQQEELYQVLFRIEAQIADLRRMVDDIHEKKARPTEIQRELWREDDNDGERP